MGVQIGVASVIITKFSSMCLVELAWSDGRRIEIGQKETQKEVVKGSVGRQEISRKGIKLETHFSQLMVYSCYFSRICHFQCILYPYIFMANEAYGRLNAACFLASQSHET